jgi:hypothetical protein
VGWPLATHAKVETVEPPTGTELETLRALEARTAAAHRREQASTGSGIAGVAR